MGGQVDGIAAVMTQAKQAYEHAQFGPIETLARIAKAKADRAEAIVDELEACKKLVEMGALSEEDYEDIKEKAVALLKTEELPRVKRRKDDDDDEDDDEKRDDDEEPSENELQP